MYTLSDVTQSTDQEIDWKVSVTHMSQDFWGMADLAERLTYTQKTWVQDLLRVNNSPERHDTGINVHFHKIYLWC